MKIVITIDLDKIQYSIETTISEIPIKGNAMASGDPETDIEAETWIQDQLRKGNDLAWCDVIVKAKIGPFEGCDSLGCVSVKDANELEEMIKEHGMRENAFDHLVQQIEHFGETNL